MLNIRCSIGTGRTYCRICDKPITKRQIATRIEGYDISAQVHSLHTDCDINKRCKHKKENK